MDARDCLRGQGWDCTARTRETARPGTYWVTAKGSGLEKPENTGSGGAGSVDSLCGHRVNHASRKTGEGDSPAALEVDFEVAGSTEVNTAGGEGDGVAIRIRKGEIDRVAGCDSIAVLDGAVDLFGKTVEVGHGSFRVRRG